MNEKPAFKFPEGTTILDVRSPAEYAKGHIPGAKSLPLFSDTERHEVGLVYKQKGRDEAVLLGLNYVGPKLSKFVEMATSLAPQRKITLYCWRGGMRSGSMAWLLRTAGFEVNVIPGGYKTWRNYVIELMTYPWRWLCIGGYTGSGKTEILHVLRALGEQIVDLEGLAKHTGSAFNAFKETQPTTEHFENLLAAELSAMDRHLPIWVEDESKMIGTVNLNHIIYSNIQSSPYLWVERPLLDRIKLLCEGYGSIGTENLKAAFKRIEKKLGGQNVLAAIEFLNEGNLEAAAEIALRYYDKAYLHSLQNRARRPLYEIDSSEKNNEQNAKSLIAWKQQHQTEYA